MQARTSASPTPRPRASVSTPSIRIVAASGSSVWLSGSSPSTNVTHPTRRPATVATRTSLPCARPATSRNSCSYNAAPTSPSVRYAATTSSPAASYSDGRATRIVTGSSRFIVIAPRSRPSVVDTLQVEAPRGSRHARIISRAALEQPSDRIRPLEHRADEGSHHVTQERVRRDRELEAVSGLRPSGLANVPPEHLVLRLGRREGSEVVLSRKCCGRGHEGIEVDRPGPPESAPRLERRALATVQDAVAIGTRTRRKAGVEARVGLGGRDDGDI